VPIIIGYVIVLGCIFGSFVMAGGHLGALFQPLELLMIGGGALGAFVVANDTKVIKATKKVLPKLFKGSKYSRELYIQLLLLLFRLLTKIRTEGLMSIESDVEEPEQSPLFAEYPLIMADEHAVEFLTDYLRLMLTGNNDPFQLENLMDNEIDTHHAEGELPVHAISKMSDGLPAFGIVAAVMGVVHTMESIGLPPAELGMLIAHALVGTFLGILLAYGFIAPLSSLAEQKLHESAKPLHCIKVTLIASLNGYPPALAIEFGRKVLFSTERPSFSEVDDEIRKSKATNK
jgi:chemotaxis protein MotA